MVLDENLKSSVPTFNECVLYYMINNHNHELNVIVKEIFLLGYPLLLRIRFEILMRINKIHLRQKARRFIHYSLYTVYCYRGGPVGNANL
jgi:hypothetical protein